MALLFCEVTLTVDQNQVKFLASGTPRTAADLDGWTAYEDFMEKHPESDDQTLPTHIHGLSVNVLFFRFAIDNDV